MSEKESEKESEKRELRNREYYTLRTIMAALSGLEGGEQFLVNRLKSVPNGLRDYRMVKTVLRKLLEKLLDTVPDKRLGQIKTELKNAHIEVKVERDYTGAYRENFTYVPNKALEEIEDIICDMFCAACEKSDKESRKCRIRKLMEMLYQYDFPERNGCPLAIDSIDG